MLLRGENLERLALDVPDLVDVEDHLRLEIAHLRLVRLEQEHRRRGIGVFGAGLVAHRLRHHAGLLREMRGIRMIEIIGIFQRVGQHEGRIELAVDIDHAVEMRLGQPQRIVAGVEELDFRAEHLGRALRLVAPAGLDLLQRRAGFLPGELALAALAERQAGDLDAIAALGVQRDRAAGAPDEIAGMRRDHEARLASIAHDLGFPPSLVCGGRRTGLVTIVWRCLPARSPWPICRYRPSAGRGFPRASWPWPRCRVRARASSSSGVSSTSRSAALSVLITSGGVPSGAKIAFHDRASKSPPPASFTVGTSGRNAGADRARRCHRNQPPCRRRATAPRCNSRSPSGYRRATARSARRANCGTERW